MSNINFLPDQYTRVTEQIIAVPVKGQQDITDPMTRRVLLPERVEISVRRDEGTERGDRVRTYVAVYGPRRLKSGEYGKGICSTGWENERNEGLHGYVPRPQWLSDLVAVHTPRDTSLEAVNGCLAMAVQYVLGWRDGSGTNVPWELAQGVREILDTMPKGELSPKRAEVLEELVDRLLNNGTLYGDSMTVTRVVQDLKEQIAKAEGTAAKAG